jgi:hypothetical protein
VSAALEVEYCGETYVVPADGRFTIGRTGDLSVDDNPYLHRSFLELRCENGVWLVANVGSQLSATIGDDRSQFVAQLAPGGVVPLAFDRTHVRFGAGPTTYEIQLVLPDPPFAAISAAEADEDSGLSDPTQVPAALTEDQRLVVLSLAEHALRRSGSGASSLPTSGEAARRVGWSERKFNKKLDQVCQKLAKAGVRGLHGEPGNLAANRRARLVEYCLASGLVTEDDLALLDQPAPE